MDVNLVLLKKNGDRRDFRMPAAITIIGRRADCDLHIPLKEVSRRHCELELNSGTLKIRDLNSSNGTFVNGLKVEQEVLVKAGDTLQVGPLTLLIQIDGCPVNVTGAGQNNDDVLASLDDLDLDNLGGASGTMQV
ncbi:MAG: hypothetical protein A2Y07_09065 [Planctomycetes bacterium GWF2_50_10]|nr:MAG: hypothetical protein A2Y07_09065 [Planctomycetes bacterium GWF2_50_10]